MIFIIGTGPSLNNVDLTRLNGQTTLALNDITKELDKFSPTYWMFMDHQFYRNYMPEILEAQKNGVQIVTCAEIPDALKAANYGNRQKLDRGEFSFYDRPGGLCYSIGAVGYTAVQWAWQQGYRKMYVTGYDSRDPYPHTNYRDDYLDRFDGPRFGSYAPDDLWGKGYDFLNEWIWDNGGEIWDISHSESGSFKYKDLDEVLV